MSAKRAVRRRAVPARRPTARERIRATARELFYREGIRAVGVDEIVRRAGATKPSLYRSFASKDVLAAECARDFVAAFWRYFDTAAAAHPGDVRAQLQAFFLALEKRMRQPSYRGCPLTNAAIEYPDPVHPARQVAATHKRELRERLTAMVNSLDVTEPELLADGVALLLEGAYASCQLFKGDGPAQSVARVVDRMIVAALRRPRRSAVAPSG